MNLLFCYSNVPNKRACTFISGKVCLLGSIKVRGQNLPEINVHARLFGTLEYARLGNNCLNIGLHFKDYI